MSKNSPYAYFDCAEACVMAGASRWAARYLVEQQVPNLILVDRGARSAAVAVREAHRILYPGVTPPRIFFVNPTWFQHQWTVVPDDSQVAFARFFPRLMADRDCPVLVFDCCCHHGHTIRPIRDWLRRHGFKDVRLAVACRGPNDSFPDDLQDMLAAVVNSCVAGCTLFGICSIVARGIYPCVGRFSTEDPHIAKRQREYTDLVREISQIVRTELQA